MRLSENAPRPFFMHRWVQQHPAHARWFNDAVYVLLALSFLTVSFFFVFSFWRHTDVRFNPAIMLPFYALLVFANLSTVVAAYPDARNASFNPDTKWQGFAVRLYPVATWAGLASTVVMLSAWLIYIRSGPLQQIAAITWAAGLLLSTPTLAYRMLFIRTLIPWEKR